MRAFQLEPGDRAVLNLTNGEAVSGEISLYDRKTGTVFVRKATMHTPGKTQPLDGGIQVPAASILWVQVV